MPSAPTCSAGWAGTPRRRSRTTRRSPVPGTRPNATSCAEPARRSADREGVPDVRRREPVDGEAEPFEQPPGGEVGLVYLGGHAPAAGPAAEPRHEPADRFRAVAVRAERGAHGVPDL